MSQIQERMKKLGIKQVDMILEGVPGSVMKAVKNICGR